MSERWYRVTTYKDRPVPVEVVKETDKTLTVSEPGWRDRKVLKSSNGDDHFKTWAEARYFIINREKMKREQLSHQMTLAAERVRLALELPEEEPA